MRAYKRILFGVIMLFLVSFLVQGTFGLLKTKPLDGVKEVARKPQFTVRNFFNVSYQDSMNTYVNENMGFRPGLVRLYSQVNFTVFRTTRAPGVVPGKKTHLFIESYINNYVGINFVGKKNADDIVARIKKVQDSLKKFNVDLLVVFAPGKASFYPNLIPDSYMARKRDTTNYTYYSKKLPAAGVNFIDFNAFFTHKKNTFAYPIYPEYGTHWTAYAYAMAFDSILRYIETKRGISIPDMDYSNIVSRDSLREREFDIGILLNLLKMPKHKPMPYPIYRYNYAPGMIKPDVLAVGDSYWWCMVGDDMPYHVFKKDEYWFYNRDIYIRNNKQDKGVADVSFANRTANRDVIILMATEATFDLFPYGFIDKAYDIYCLSANEKIQMVSSQIKGDTAWMKQIRAKAKENKLSEAEQFEKDVVFVIERDLTPVHDPARFYGAIIAELMQKMRSDKEWLEKIKAKAAENKVPLDMQLEEDAWFMYNSEYGSDEVKQELANVKRRILGTPEWKAQVETKAREKGILFEEMLELDAKFVYDSELKGKK